MTLDQITIPGSIDDAGRMDAHDDRARGSARAVATTDHAVA